MAREIPVVGNEYVIDGGRYVRVSAVIDMLAKPGLVPWAAKVTAERAVPLIVGKGLPPPEVVAGDDYDHERLRKWISRAPTEAKETAADVGTAVHAAIEEYASGAQLSPWPTHLGAFGVHFARFVEDWQPEFVESECVVFDRDSRYAGRFDAVARIRGRLTLLDVKTGRGLYPESLALQLSAYRYASHMFRGAKAEANVRVDRCAVLHLRPGGYALRPVEAGDRAFLRFVQLRGVYEWAKVESTRALGEALDPRSVSERVA